MSVYIGVYTNNVLMWKCANVLIKRGIQKLVNIYQYKAKCANQSRFLIISTLGHFHISTLFCLLFLEVLYLIVKCFSIDVQHFSCLLFVEVYLLQYSHDGFILCFAGCILQVEFTLRRNRRCLCKRLLHILCGSINRAMYNRGTIGYLPGQ